jgi:outer membrane protein assembly factor BamB
MRRQTESSSPFVVCWCSTLNATHCAYESLVVHPRACTPRTARPRSSIQCCNARKKRPLVALTSCTTGAARAQRRLVPQDSARAPQRLVKHTNTTRAAAITLLAVAGLCHALACRAVHAPPTQPMAAGSSTRSAPCPPPKEAISARSLALRRAGPSTTSPKNAPTSEAVVLMEPIWRFCAGAPLNAPPALAQDGSVVVASSDGYIDLLQPDGTPRWSYTVDGTIAGAVAVGKRSITVGTSAGQLVSLAFDGTARWKVHVPNSITTRVQPERLGLMFFGAGSGRVYGAFSTGAAISFGVGAAVSAGPIRLGNGTFALGTAAGQLILFDRTGIKRASAITKSALLDLFEGDVSVLYVLSGNDLFALDQAGQILWVQSGVRAAAPAGGNLLSLVNDGTELEWLDHSGRVQRRIQLRAQASAAPVVSPDGLVYVPRVDGRLDGLSDDGIVRTTLAVCGAPLLRPIPDFHRSRLLVAGGDGTVVAVSVGLQPSSRSR